MYGPQMDGIFGFCVVPCTTIVSLPPCAVGAETLKLLWATWKAWLYSPAVPVVWMSRLSDIAFAVMPKPSQVALDPRDHGRRLAVLLCELAPRHEAAWHTGQDLCLQPAVLLAFRYDRDILGCARAGWSRTACNR